MSDWATLFRNFIYRDVAFILGGSIVLASAAYCFDLWDPNALREFPIFYVILFAALAYVVGYAVQDFLGIFRISTTATPYTPRCVMRCIFWCFTRMNWTNINYGNSPEFEIDMDRRDVPPRTVQALDRIVSLKVVSMCVGACLLASALFVLCHRPTQWFISGMSFRWSHFDIVLGLVCFGFGLVLIILGRLKAMQEMQFNQAMRERGYLVSSQRRT
jgi:hypothetical protein